MVEVIRDKFGLAAMVMVGDRGMITSARIAALNRLQDGTARPGAYGWGHPLGGPASRDVMGAGGARARERPCGPRPKSCWPRSSRAWRPGDWPAPARSGSRWARSSPDTRPP